MSKLKISEEQLREVLLSMSGDDIQKLFIEVKKGIMVGEIMDCGVESIMEAVKLLDWMDFVKETAEDLFPEKEL